jgi:hypothetical protein
MKAIDALEYRKNKRMLSEKDSLRAAADVRIRSIKRMIIEVEIYRTAVGSALPYQNRRIQVPPLCSPPFISSISARFLPSSQ